MMRKTLWIVAVVFAISVTQIMTAQMTDITFDVIDPSIGTTQGVLTDVGGLFTLTLEGDTFTTTNSIIGSDLGQSCTTYDTGDQCEWELSGNEFDFWPIGLPAGIILRNAQTSTPETWGYGYYPNTAVPEPNVYLLALLGVFFTRNRISQGLRQAIRWNYRLPALH